MRTIGLIELYAHSEVLRTYLRVMRVAGFALKVFCSQVVAKDLQAEATFQSTPHKIMRDKESRPQFIRRCRTQLEQCDLLIFITLTSNFFFFSRLRLSPPQLLIIHNGYTFLSPCPNLHFRHPLTDRLRLLRQWLKGEWFFRQRMLRNMSYLSFPSPTLQIHLQQQGLLKSYSIGPVLPFGYYEGSPQATPPKRLNIVVPGAVSEEGRSYRDICDAIRRAVPRLKQPIRLILLGRVKEQPDEMLFALLEDCDRSLFELKYYEDLVPQEEFDRQLQQADFLLLPLKKHLQFGIIREYYGYSNISGGINDWLRFGHAAIISSHYPLEPALEKLCQRYRDRAELAELIVQWVNEKTYQRMRSQAPLLLEED
ncbi:MAG: hypothetical protein AAGG75_17935, partial [Bacteroidota bacterium]